MTDEPQRIEFLWNVHSYVNEYIRFADTKAELVIGWTSAVMGALVAGKVQSRFSLSLHGLLTVTGFAFLVAAFAFAFVVVKPRLRRSHVLGQIFWKSILAHKDKDAFAAAVKSQTIDATLDHLCGHLFDLARIADAKFWWVGNSIALAFGGSLLSGTMWML